MRMMDRWLRKVSPVATPGVVLALVLAAVGVGVGCAGGAKIPPEKPTGPPLPFVAGAYNCAASGTWRTTSFAGLVPAVQRAVANENAQEALSVLLSRHYDEEVTCVAGYIHDESVKQQMKATDKGLPAQRVAATTAWIDQQSARGLTVANYGGEAR
jgi:hypothetical protein